MNHRRKLLIVLGAGALAAPVISFAQQQGKTYRIGVLTDSAASPGLQGFFQGLRELGYVEGKNILIERRFTGDDTGKLLPFARELAALKVDVILANSSTESTNSGLRRSQRDITMKIRITAHTTVATSTMQRHDMALLTPTRGAMANAMLTRAAQTTRGQR